MGSERVKTTLCGYSDKMYQHVRTQGKNTNPGRVTVFGAGEKQHSNITVGQRDRSVLMDVTVKLWSQTKVVSLTR